MVIDRKALRLVAILVLPWVASITFAKPAPRTQKAQGDWILSLRLQRDHVFATTADGLYRARLDKKQWERLDGQSVPEPGGLFVADRAEEKTLFYFVTPSARHAAAFASDSDKVKDPRHSGLYRSLDLGATWKLMNHVHDFERMVRLPGGRLFALTQLRENMDKEREYRQQVLMSDSDGRDWKDVGNGVATNYPLLFFTRDPDHPQCVCLYSAFTMRRGGVVLQAADETFRWKSVLASLRADHEWPPDEKKTEEEFFDHWYYVGYGLNWPAGAVQRLPEEFPGETFRKDGTGIGTSAGIHARLDNYFALPFGNARSFSGFDIVPDKTKYVFRTDEPLRVNVALNYRTEGTPRLFPHLVDACDVRHFWSLKVSGPGTQKRELWPKDQANPFADLKNVKLADVLKKHDAWEFRLTPAKPARRAIDLRELGMPTQQGTYRVQLRFHNRWTDDRGISRSLNTVTGRVFTVRIQRARY